MIQNTFNAISSGAAGMFGRQVVRYVRHGREIIAKAPRKRPGKGTPGQEVTRGNFKQGAAWSKKVRKTPELHMTYKAALYGGLNVHNLAIADALQAPVIHVVQVVNGAIVVHATDNFQVASVKVMIYHANGNLLEAGLAGKGEEDRWMYRPVDLPAGCSIVIVACDLPGNECRYELTGPGMGTAVVLRTMVRVIGLRPLALQPPSTDTG